MLEEKDQARVVLKASEGYERLWTRTSENVCCPLVCSMWNPMLFSIFVRLAEDWALPYRTLQFRCFNGWQYCASVPLQSAEEEASRVQRRQAVLESRGAKLRKQWETDYLPQILRDHAALRRKVTAGCTGLTFLQECLGILERHTWIDCEVGTASEMIFDRLASIYGEATGDTNPLSPHKLVQGYNNAIVEGEKRMWDLVALARECPQVEILLAEAPADMLERLGKVPEAQPFLEQLASFLEEYGLHDVGTCDISELTWAEDPSHVLQLIGTYLRRPQRDWDVELRCLAEERERFVAEVRRKIGANSLQRRFNHYLSLAQSTYPLIQDHSILTAQFSKGLLRRAFLNTGAKLVESSLLAVADDVFYVTWEELVAVLTGQAPTDLAQAIEERRWSKEMQRKLTPPRSIGGSSAFKAVPTFPAEATPPRKEMRGVPASAGWVRGTARILYSLEQAARLRSGDILVCSAMTPLWTHLLTNNVKALICNSGGALSHAAIVARECRIPAVVGVEGATETIGDGQSITVDGTLGVVYLH
jgi:phosphohistidine swiveling domain-containing protein